MTEFLPAQRLMADIARAVGLDPNTIIEFTLHASAKKGLLIEATHVPATVGNELETVTYDVVARPRDTAAPTVDITRIVTLGHHRMNPIAYIRHRRFLKGLERAIKANRATPSHLVHLSHRPLPARERPNNPCPPPSDPPPDRI